MMINKKPKVYYQLGNVALLSPNAGDTINEFNNIKAMLEYFEVYYNGVRCNTSDDSFGRDDDLIPVPKTGVYDIIYVRNNRELFLQCPRPKLWFASPYFEDCFQEADGIVCMTKSWRDRLITYTSQDAGYFVDTYPKNMKAPKRVLLFPQSMTRIKPSSTYKKEINTAKSSFNLRHFGPIRQSNYPHQLFSLLQREPDFGAKLTIECYGSGSATIKNSKILKSAFLGRLVVRGLHLSKRKFRPTSSLLRRLFNKFYKLIDAWITHYPPQVKIMPRIAREDIDGILRQTDGVWYNLGASGNVAGSLKILEAMAYGIPILLPKWDARVEELGEDYPLFWNLKPGSDISDPDQPDFFRALNLLINMSDEERKKLKKRLIEKSQNYTPKASGKVIASEINNFLAECQKKC